MELTEKQVEREILRLIEKHGELGWYRLEMSVRISRENFPKDTGVMTFVYDLFERGMITCQGADDLGDGKARYKLTEMGKAYFQTLTPVG